MAVIIGYIKYILEAVLYFCDDTLLLNGVYQPLQNLQKGCHSKGTLIKIGFDMDIVIFGCEKNFFEK